MNQESFLWVLGTLTTVALGLCSWALLRVVSIGEKMIEFKGDLEKNVGLIEQSLGQLTRDLEKVSSEDTVNRMARLEAQVWGVRGTGGDSQELIRARGYLHWMTNWAMAVQGAIDTLNRHTGREAIQWTSVDQYLRRTAGESREP